MFEYKNMINNAVLIRGISKTGRQFNPFTDLSQ